jgi:3-deoxy-D-arabino-heptulosonate 7-phosphate (DAHP) synthase
MGYTFAFLAHFDKKEKQIFLKANKHTTADQLFYAVKFVQSRQCRSAKPANGL